MLVLKVVNTQCGNLKKNVQYIFLQMVMLKVDKSSLPDNGISIQRKAYDIEQDLKAEEQKLNKMVVETEGKFY